MPRKPYVGKLLKENIKRIRKISNVINAIKLYMTVCINAKGVILYVNGVLEVGKSHGCNR